MIYNIDYNELIRKVNPITFSKYLQDTGWEQFHTKRKDIRIFQKKQEEFSQVIIPMNEMLSDYYEALYLACQEVAKIENRSIEQLLLYLLNPNADILKIHIEKRAVESGSILIDDAIKVYENAKKMLGAAAQDVLKPTLIHQGRIDTSVTEFLAGCRFGQTEVGSYVISVICPMTEVENGEVRQLNFFDDEQKEEKNFTRKVTEKVVTSIQRLKDRIDEGQYSLAETCLEDQTSINFYEALIGINLEEEGTIVEYIPEWAPGFPVTAEVPESVSISHHYYQPILAAVTKIKGAEKKKRKIVGRIKRLEASPDLENRDAGKVTIIYVDENNKAKTAVAKLEKADYCKAIDAHANGLYVEIVGEMSSGRNNEIECESFDVI